MANLLLVEDNEMIRDIVSHRLERRGYAVVTASDGAEGVDMARARQPDLILLDLSLPIIDGWEAARRIKADEATRDIPIIALTAHAMSGDREQALQAGCDDYEVKPVDMDRLVGKIETLLRGAVPQAEEA